MLGSMVGLGGAASALSAGAAAGTIEEAWSLLTTVCTVFIPLCFGGLVLDRKRNTELKANQLVQRNALEDIAKKYNDVTQLLEYSFKEEKRGKSHRQEEKLRKLYEEKYFQNRDAFNRERVAYLETHDTRTKTSRRFTRYWKWLIGIGLLTQIVTFCYTIGVQDALSAPAPQARSLAGSEEQGEPIYWNADNIVLPHLTDGSRYVSNPDGVVTANTEQQLNQWFRKLDDSLQIESAVILVNHIENDDPFRMAQDVGNKYGVGKADRGLVVILGYQDHSINISPGRSLEADLTDAECVRLEREYVIPSMKAEQPDSGMLYLAEGIYNTLQKKELPEMTFISQAQEKEDAMSNILSIYIILFVGWGGLIFFLLLRYRGNTGSHLLAANPFMAEPEVTFVGGGGGFGGGGGHSGGGGGFGGGYSGGSFGGGGATARW